MEREDEWEASGGERETRGAVAIRPSGAAGVRGGSDRVVSDRARAARWSGTERSVVPGMGIYESYCEKVKSV